MNEELDTGPAGFMVFDDNGTILRVNQTLITLLGFESKEALIGTTISAIITTAGRIFYQTHFFPLIKLHNKAEEIYFQLKSKTGESIPCFWNAVRKQTGDAFENHCMVFAVRERAKYENEILEAKKNAELALSENIELNRLTSELKEQRIELDNRVQRLTNIHEDILQFSKIVSHDLQETLHKIGVLADKVATLSRDTLPQQRIEELMRINMECRKMRELAAYIEAHMSMNIIREDPQPVDLNAAAHNAFIQVTHANPNSNAKINVASLPAIEGYAHQLTEMFRVIFENTLQSNESSHPLEISITHEVMEKDRLHSSSEHFHYTGFIKMLITHNGSQEGSHGNPFEIRDVIAVRPVSRRFGLSLAKKIVDNHDGTIRMSDGCTIEIFLPLAQRHSAESH